VGGAGLTQHVEAGKEEIDPGFEDSVAAEETTGQLGVEAVAEVVELLHWQCISV